MFRILPYIELDTDSCQVACNLIHSWPGEGSISKLVSDSRTRARFLILLWFLWGHKAALNSLFKDSPCIVPVLGYCSMELLHKLYLVWAWGHGWGKDRTGALLCSIAWANWPNADQPGGCWRLSQPWNKGAQSQTWALGAYSNVSKTKKLC